MNRKERVLRQARGQEVDRVPLMGGWIQSAEILASLASVGEEAYIANPSAAMIRAHEALGVDCMVFPLIPPHPSQVRVGQVLDACFSGIEPENLKRDGDNVPDEEKRIIASLDGGAITQYYRSLLGNLQNLLGEIVLIPTFWEAVPNFMMYGQYGYEAYLLAIKMYPESVARLYRKSAVEARFRNQILVRLLRELDLPPVLFTGHDICNNAGPMCSMDFLREHYFPQERYALEPLVEAGIRVVRHCDGNVMPLIGDSYAAGYSGFQGFQYECGIDPYAIVEQRPAAANWPLFFAGMNVTRTLPFGSRDAIREEIEYVMDFTAGGRGLFFFSSSSIGAEVPAEHVRFAYDYAAHLCPAPRGSSPVRRRWPGMDL